MSSRIGRCSRNVYSLGVVRYLAGIIMLFAALAKWEQLPVLLITETSVISRPYIMSALIPLEVAFAALLMFYRWPSVVSWIPSAAFATLAVIAASTALSGADSCGCFGRLKVNPWITTMADGVLATCLWRGRRGLTECVTRLCTERWATLSVCMALIGVALTVPRMSSQKRSSEIVGLIQVGELNIIEADKWIGNKLPILDEIEGGYELQDGVVVAVFYHHDCGLCRRNIPRFVKFADSCKVFLVEMPPYEKMRAPREERNSQIHYGRLAASKDWFATTPLLVLLDDGVVKDVVSGSDAVTAELDVSQAAFVLSRSKQMTDAESGNHLGERR